MLFISVKGPEAQLRDLAEGGESIPRDVQRRILRLGYEVQERGLPDPGLSEFLGSLNLARAELNRAYASQALTPAAVPEPVA